MIIDSISTMKGSKLFRLIRGRGADHSNKAGAKTENAKPCREKSSSFLGSTITVSMASTSNDASLNEPLHLLLHKLATTARRHGKNRELNEAWECCATIKEILKRNADQSPPCKKLLAETYYRMALIYETNDDLDEAMDHFRNALKLFRHCREQEARDHFVDFMIESHIWIIKSMVQISELQMAVENWDDALETADRATKEISLVPPGVQVMELRSLKDKIRCNLNTILENSGMISI